MLSEAFLIVMLSVLMPSVVMPSVILVTVVPPKEYNKKAKNFLGLLV